MIELNLLPDVKQEFVRTERMKKTMISLMILISMVAVGIVVFLGAVTYLVQPGLLALVDGNIKTTSKKLEDDKDLVRNLTIQNQLKVLPSLHDEKTVYYRALDYLRVLNPETPNNVTYSKVSINGITSQLSFEATSKDYQSAAVFRDTLLNAQLKYKDPDDLEGGVKTVPLFSEVSLSEVSIGKDQTGKQSASLKATLTYDPILFAWKAEPPTVIVPNKKTSPSADKDALFSERKVTDPVDAEAVGGQ